MKRFNIIIVGLALFITACNPTINDPSEIEKQYYEYCKIVVEMTSMLENEGGLNTESIKYFNSKEANDNFAKLKKISEEMNNIAKTREDHELLVPAKSNLEVIDKLIYYSVKYKDTPEEHVKLLNNEEQLDLSGAFVGSKTILDAKKRYIKEYDKKYGINK